MKLLLTSFFIICTFSSWASYYGTQKIKQYILDERNVYTVRVSLDRPTTVLFPSAPSALDGVNIFYQGASKEPLSTDAFLISYVSGRHFFTLQALQSKAEANLNVIWQDKAYVLQLIEDKNPNFTVTFLYNSAANDLPTVSPTRLLSLLDRAKAFPILAENSPEILQEIELSKPARVCFYPDFEVIIEEIYRFNPEDTLVFRVQLKNLTTNEILYQPQSFAVRCGDNVYYQSISDASGIMPSLSTTPAYFAITGTANGGRNNLSANSKFNVLVSRIRNSTAPTKQSFSHQMQTNSIMSATNNISQDK